MVKRKSKPSRSRAQAGKSPAAKRIAKEIAEETAYLKELKKRRNAIAAQERREKKSRATAAKRRKTKTSRHYKTRERESRQAARQRTATSHEIREINKLVAVGIYKPKKQKRTKGGQRTYTKGQARTAKRAAKKNKGILSGKFAFVKVPKKERAAFKRAGLPVTRTSVVVYKEEEFDDFKMVKDRQGRPELVGTIKKRRGRRQKKIAVTAITLDDMARQEIQMQAAFEARARELPPGHRIRFFVDGEYGSTRTFSAGEFPQFMAAIAAYRRSNATLYKFRRALKIGIIGPGIPRNTERWTDAQYDLFSLSNATTGTRSRKKRRPSRRITGGIHGGR